MCLSKQGNQKMNCTFDYFNSCVIDEFQHVVKSCKQYTKLPFKFDTEFATSYFGKDKSGSLSYADFTHFMRVRNFAFYSLI